MTYYTNNTKNNIYTYQKIAYDWR